MISLLRRHAAAKGAYHVHSSGNYFFRNNSAKNELMQVAEHHSQGVTVYVNHALWINATALSLPKPVGAMQLIREPVARLVSNYNYHLWGARPKRKKQKARSQLLAHTQLLHVPTINEFVAWAWDTHGLSYGCLTNHSSILDLSIAPNLMTRFFCGHSAVCTDLCSTRALDRAKMVMTTQYNVVGLVERFREFVQALECASPTLFSNMLQVYDSMHASKQNTKTCNVSQCGQLSGLTAARIARWSGPDIELYKHATNVFDARFRLCLTG